MSKRNFDLKLDRAIGKMDIPLGDLDYLQAEIRTEIERLKELLREVNERAEKLTCAIDLNKKIDIEEDDKE